MSMFKYILKRLGLLVVTFFIIMTICFVLIKLLEPAVPLGGSQATLEAARREALGYSKPIMEQYRILLRNIVFDNFNWGYSWKIDYMEPVGKVIADRLPATVIMNVYSIVFSIPFGILLGIWAALKKNKMTDHVISTSVMFFISVPTFVYAFLVQYFMGFKTGWFPVIASSLYDSGGSWFTWTMTKSLVLPVLSMSFGSIAFFARYTRAELTEALTSEYMLLARAKGLKKRTAVIHHAMKNAMVPILPSILAQFLGLIGGSMIIERIFSVNGIGGLFLRSIFMLDYDVFLATCMFYVAISLSSMIIIDLSYGFLDPRIRMGER